MSAISNLPEFSPDGCGPTARTGKECRGKNGGQGRPGFQVLIKREVALPSATSLMDGASKLEQETSAHAVMGVRALSLAKHPDSLL